MVRTTGIFMSQLNVGTLNVGTTTFTGDSSTLNSAPAGTITAMVSGTPSANHSIMYNGSQWVPTLMEGRLLALNVYCLLYTSDAADE